MYIYSQQYLETISRQNVSNREGVLLRLPLDPTKNTNIWDVYHGASTYYWTPVFPNGETDLFIVMAECEQAQIILWVDTKVKVQEKMNTYVASINPSTHKFQLYKKPAETTTATVAEKVSASNEKKAFDHLSDTNLMDIGVPTPWLERVRAVITIEDLRRLEDGLPQRAYEALTAIFQGEDFESVREDYALEASPNENAEPTTAFDPGQFLPVVDDTALRNLMNASLETWRTFLHPTQKKLVDTHWRGPHRVFGGAGTGKTVVAIHRAAHLVQLPDWGEKDKLLFTTFTRNLATDLSNQLSKLLDADHLARIEVINIDAWVSSMLRRYGIGRKVIYDTRPEYKDCWQEALTEFDCDAISESECFEEWKTVIQPQGIMTQMEYFLAHRQGRGKALTRTDRKQLWPVFERMRFELSQRGLITASDAAYLILGEVKKRAPEGLYRAVVVDEIQDFSPEMLKLLRAITPDTSDASKALPEGDLFMVGDPHQRIYERFANFKQCGIHIVGRSHRLRVNYRTTEEIRNTGVSVLNGIEFDNMNGGKLDTMGYVSLRHGPTPSVYFAETINDELAWILKGIKEQVAKGIELEEICVTTHKHDDIVLIENYLNKHQIPTRWLKSDDKDDSSAIGVRLATMHRIKGLEFKSVFVAFASMIQPDPTLDPVTIKKRIATTSSLYHVAFTRAIESLYVSSNANLANPLALVKENSQN